MNLRRPNANEATGTFNRSRDVVPMSGICTRCIDGCKGGCETWLASFRGREVLYPGPFGEMTAEPIRIIHLTILISTFRVMLSVRMVFPREWNRDRTHPSSPM